MARRLFKRDRIGRFAKDAGGSAASASQPKPKPKPKRRRAPVRARRRKVASRPTVVEDGPAIRIDRAATLLLLKPVVDAVAGSKAGSKVAGKAQKKIQKLEQDQMRGKKIVSEKF